MRRWPFYLLLALDLTACDRISADAQIDLLRVQPTATAAALANQERGIYVAAVVPAQAAADAASITARTAQQIREEANRQELQHAGEMAALTLTNTQQLNEQTESHVQRLQAIAAAGAARVADYQAAAQRSAASAWRDTGIAVAVALAGLIALVGGAWGVIVALGNRAKIITHPSVGVMVLTRSYIALPARSGGPLMLIRRDGAVFPLGPDQRAVTERAQQWTLLSTALGQGASPEQALKLLDRPPTPVPWPPPEPPAAPLPLSAPASAPATIPAFADLLRAWSPSLTRLLLAIGADGQPIYGTIDQMLSGIIIGRQGQGKTTLLRMVYVQCALAGVQILTWDLHDDIAQQLPGVQAYTSLAEIKVSARQLIAEFDQRQRLHLTHDRAAPIMLLIDEVNRLAGLLPEVIEAIERFVAEGRKYRMFCFVTAKGAPSTLFEHRWVRDAFSTRWVFNASATEARTIGIEAEKARLAPNLPIGQALLDGPIAPAIVTIPNITPADAQALLPVPRPLPGRFPAASSAPSSAPSSAASDPLPDHLQEGAEGAAAGERKREIVRDRLKQGQTNAQIIRDLWGVTSGRKYQQAALELQKLIQELIA